MSKKRGTVTLLCLPNAGGNARLFRSWHDHTQPWLRVQPVEYPGRGSRVRESLPSSMEELVADVLPIVEAAGDQPVALFGHSMGASVAYAVARELCAQARPSSVRHLFVSAAGAPGTPSTRPPMEHASDQQVAHELSSLGGTPAELLRHPDMVRFLARVLRSDDTLLREFHSRQFFEPLDIPITGIYGVGDDAVLLEAFRRWKWATSARFQERLLAGGHFYFLDREAAVMGIIATELESLWAGEGD